MMVRTYGRRDRPSETYNNDVFEISDSEGDPFAFKEDDHLQPSSSSSLYRNNFEKTRLKKNTNSSFSQETLEFQESSLEPFNFTFSSQDSTRFERNSNDSESSSPGSSLQLLRPRKRESVNKVRKLSDTSRSSKASLMETQECGEMMECVDEVEFALDGLRQRHQGIRVRRASLLALLNVCSSPQQRRLLKAQGMAKAILDVIVDLRLDDSSSNLAAATLFYVLTKEVQDHYLLETSPSIQFLLKLLKPIVAERAAEKAPSISQKLVAFRKDMLDSQDMASRTDLSPTSILQKVLETLVSCKDLKATGVDENYTSRPELNPDWVSLLTLEKACLSTVSLEDSTGTVRKTSGNFKEKLRQLGGFDAVFQLAMKSFSTLERLIKHVAPSTSGKLDGKLHCLPSLLKCLKIMENATFLSKDNQRHLLGLEGRLPGLGSSLSFVKLMVNFIEILSELSLWKPSSKSSEMPAIISSCSDHRSELLSKAVDSGVISTRLSQECSSTSRNYSDSGLSTTQNSQRSSASDMLPKPGSGSGSECWLGNSLIDTVNSSGSGSCSLTVKRSDNGPDVKGYGTKTIIACGEGTHKNDNDMDIVIDLDDSQDPFAFDEGDIALSKWDKPSGRNKGRRKPKRHLLSQDVDMCLSQPMLSQEGYPSQPMLSQEPIDNVEENESIHFSSDTSCTTTIDEENSSLVADCLLTAIKVLMNLTNDNALGCRQIATCGGLEMLSSLIARHFPSFSLSSGGERKEQSPLTESVPGHNQIDVHLNEHELDFLVTILGLLVNLVENDSDNRSRLAATKVVLPSLGGLNVVRTGVIPLLCAIFLANRGAGEATEEEQSWDDEEAVLQGEKEAEKMIVEAYAALLLAFLSTESKNIRNSIANYLPEHNMKVLVPVLDRFVTFHMTMNMISPETHKTVSEVIESCRLP